MDAPSRELRGREASSETRLSERRPCYTELKIRGDTSGTGYEALFLVPVYARRGVAGG